MEKIILVIPAYNEEENVLNVYNTIKEYNKKSEQKLDYVFINDGSKDNTLKILKEKMRVSAETLRTMEYAVEKLEEYTKLRYKNNKILFDDYKIIDTSSDDAISDFNDFDDF